MSNSGSGVGTPIAVTTKSIDPWPNRALSLAQYAQIIGYDQCAFWGVFYDGQERFDCYTQWSEYQRMAVARSIAEAENLIEDVLGYPLAPTFIVEQTALDTNPFFGRWGQVLGAGVRATSTLQANATVSYVSEPATIGPIATSITDPKEVHIFYPGTDREITPSLVSIAGGFLTVRIPRCRLVADPVNPKDGYDYTDTLNFLDGVDVRRIYADRSVNATLYRRDCAGCAEVTASACMAVLDPDLGELRLQQGSYVAGVWKVTGLVHCGGWHRAKLFYQAGLTQLDPVLQDAIVRLAHARMPQEPCGCDITQGLWKRDRNIPQIVTRERINCPFGMSDGAFHAWKIAQSKRLWRMGVL